MRTPQVKVVTAALLTLSACSAAPHSKEAGGVATLAVKPVAWNAANAPIGKVTAVADSGEVVAVFSDDGASILSARAVVATDTHVKGWTAGSAIDATDTKGVQWIVGIAKDGHVYRLRGMSTFEDVGARYGLAAKHVRGATMVAPGKVGFLLDNQIALSDANKMSVFGTGAFSAFAGGGGFAAGVGKDSIDVVNTTNEFVTRYPLEGAKWAAVDSKGHVFAATERGIYSADASGALQLVFDAGHDGIHGLVASGDRVWFADRGELGVVNGSGVAETSGANIGDSAVLDGSPSGDVWVISGGKLARFEALGDAPAVNGGAGGAGGAAPAGPAPVTSTWSSMIAPVFARSCAQCHQANGVSGVDLSTEASWQGKRTLINERVLVSRSMPPSGHTISDADRDAIHTWISAGPQIH